MISLQDHQIECLPALFLAKRDRILRARVGSTDVGCIEDGTFVLNVLFLGATGSKCSSQAEHEDDETLDFGHRV